MKKIVLFLFLVVNLTFFCSCEKKQVNYYAFQYTWQQDWTLRLYEDGTAQKLAKDENGNYELLISDNVRRLFWINKNNEEILLCYQNVKDNFTIEYYEIDQVNKKLIFKTFSWLVGNELINEPASFEQGDYIYIEKVVF